MTKCIMSRQLVRMHLNQGRNGVMGRDRTQQWLCDSHINLFSKLNFMKMYKTRGLNQLLSQGA